MSTISALAMALRAKHDAEDLYMAAVNVADSLAGFDRSHQQQFVMYKTLLAFSNYLLLASETHEAAKAYRALRAKTLSSTTDSAIRHWLSVNS